MSPLESSKPYTGLERRAIFKRRAGLERRNLIRYESIGIDRRGHSVRRKEDALLPNHIF